MGSCLGNPGTPEEKAHLLPGDGKSPADQPSSKVLGSNSSRSRQNSSSNQQNSSSNQQNSSSNQQNSSSNGATVPTPEPGIENSLEQRQKSRSLQEQEELNDTIKIVNEMNSEDNYCMEEKLLCLGARLQKQWIVGVQQRGRGKVLLTLAPLTKRCALNMKKSLKIFNALMEKLGKHPLLQPILEIQYRGDKVAIFQPLMPEGSLRDHLHQVKSPLKDWAVKYKETGKIRMRPNQIALCVKSILEGLRFLYNLGFPPVGHVQSGNIFKTRDGYKLGGYENTLLGYKSRYHHMCQPYGNWIDIIMLGHVIYEMASQGRELTAIVPEVDSSDYQHVKDDIVKGFLRKIFSMVTLSSMVSDSDYKDAVDELLGNEFFAWVLEGSVNTSFDCELKDTEKDLLEEAREGREKQQKEVKSDAPSKEKLVSIINKNYLVAKRGYPALTADELLSIGTRPGKYWAKVQRQGETVHLLSVAKVSSNCSIWLSSSNMTTIRSFFSVLKKEPYLFPVVDLKYYEGHVLLLQEFKAGGSLRDLIYQTRPWLRWSEKGSRGKGLKKDLIRSYARQLLMACRRLYDLGFPELGQIQSGNIFIEGDVLCLGGFENTLLGYSSELFQQYPGYVDRLMFGHVVFEMAAGTTSGYVIPSEDDYNKINDKEVRLFVRALFSGLDEVTNSSACAGAAKDTSSDSGGRLRRFLVSKGRKAPVVTEDMEWIEKIFKNRFFGAESLPPLKGDTNCASKMKGMFESVRRHKAKKQTGVNVVRALKSALMKPVAGAGHEKKKRNTN